MRTPRQPCARCPDAPISVQFWFFYTYNYLQTGGVLRQATPGCTRAISRPSRCSCPPTRTNRATCGWHVTRTRVGCSSGTRSSSRSPAGISSPTPRGAVMPSYESCRRQSRAIQAPAGLVDDRPQCDVKQELRLRAGVDAPHRPVARPVGVLARALRRAARRQVPRPRALRERRGSARPALAAVLRRRALRAVPRRARLHITRRRPHGRSGRGGAHRRRVAARLRAQVGGQLDPAVDECSDWEHPPSAGAFLLACDQDELTRYLQVGPGEAWSTTGLRIDVVGTAADGLGR